MYNISTKINWLYFVVRRSVKVSAKAYRSAARHLWLPSFYVWSKQLSCI